MAEQQSLGTYKQDECVELIQTCASCSYVNFTSVKYPDSTKALGNVEAQKQGSEYNYTFCQTSQLGQYIVNGIGDVDGTDTVFAYDFDVTHSGYKNQDDSASMVVTLFVLLINGLVFIVPFIVRFTNSDFSNNIIKKSLWLFGLALLSLNTNIIAAIADFAGLNITNSLFNIYLFIFNWGLYFGMIFIIINTIYSSLKIIKENNTKRNQGYDMNYQNG